MNITGIIPARMASTRFPNKPMAKILGMPMIGHVYHRSKMCIKLNDVWVATCDREIFNYIVSIGGKTVITADTHRRASDRTAEALTKIERQTGKKINFVAMIQGDEPMLMPDMLDELISPIFDHSELSVVNLMSRIGDQEEFNNANVVKVVFDQEQYALYFSREPIPSKKIYCEEIPMWKQLGIILFSRNVLLEYINMSPTPLEIIESIDMNRFLEHGVKIKMIETQYKSYGVDIPSDIAYVEAKLANDPLVHSYLKL